MHEVRKIAGICDQHDERMLDDGYERHWQGHHDHARVSDHVVSCVDYGIIATSACLYTLFLFRQSHLSLWFLGDVPDPGLQLFLFFFFQAEDGIRDLTVTGVQTCALPILGCASVLSTVSVLPKDARSPRVVLIKGTTPKNLPSSRLTGVGLLKV